MRRYKVRYGASVATREMEDGTTIAQIKHDPNFRAQLGYGDNVNAVYNGVVLSDSAEAPEFIDSPEAMTNPYYGAIVMETKANDKQ